MVLGLGFIGPRVNDSGISGVARYIFKIVDTQFLIYEISLLQNRT